jgi:hypothetical protein
VLFLFLLLARSSPQCKVVCCEEGERYAVDVNRVGVEKGKGVYIGMEGKGDEGDGDRCVNVGGVNVEPG